jgi:hypothetical protein
VEPAQRGEPPSRDAVVQYPRVLVTPQAAFVPADTAPGRRPIPARER